MAAPEEVLLSASPRDSDVEDLFDEFLDRLEAGGAEDFETFVARHPDLDRELRALYASWSRLDARLESALPEPIIDESFFHGTEPGGGLPPELSPAPPTQAGTIVAADYRLLKLIGKGGMGHVWEAEQLSIGRRVALKLIRPGRGHPGDPAALAREARAGGRLNHPGLVTVHAAGVADGVHYIAQELVGEGFTLADFIERRRSEALDDGRAYRKLATLFAQVAEAVHSAHEAGILHRDLKPSNILIGDGDLPKVSDFGLAHLGDDAERSARPGFLGTWAYMSPEQAAGRDIAIDRRSDIFSLGAVFYEALTLRRAFEGDTGEQIVEQLVHVDPPDPRSIRSRIPRDLAVICQAALAKNRSDRFQSMAHFAGDLRRFLADEPIEARPQDLLTRALKWSRRHPAWTTAAVLLSLALLVISSLLLNEVVLRQNAQESNLRADERAQEALRQSYLASVRSAVMNLERGRSAEARAVLAGCLPEQRGWEWRHFFLAADLSVLHLSGHGGKVTSVASDGQGERLLSGSDDGTVRLWDGASGQTLAMLDGLGGPISAVALSADGTTMVAGGLQGTVVVWTGPAPFAVQTLNVAGPAIAALTISADGQLIAASDDRGALTVWNRTDGQRYDLPADSSAYPLSISLSADGSRLVAGSRHGQILYYSLGQEVPRGRPELLVDWYLQDNVRADVSVALSADGSHIFAGLVDGRVGSWSSDYDGDVVSFDDDDRQGVALLEPSAFVLAATADEHPALGLWNLGALTADGRGSGGSHGAESGAGASVGAGEEAWPALLGGPLVAGASLSLTLEDTGLLLVGYPEAGRDVVTLSGHSGPVNALVLSADGRRLVSASSEEDSIRVWDLAGHREVSRLTGHSGPIHALAMSADGSTIVAGCGENDALVWMGDTLGASVALPALDKPANALALSDDGSVLLSGSILENVARVWDGNTGQLRLTLPGHPIGVTCLAMSADGQTLVTGSYDKHVRIWDGSSGEQRTVLVGHRSGITSVAANAAGSLVVSGSHDKTARLWDTATSHTVQVFEGSRSPVTSVAIDGPGTTLVAGSEDGTVRLWRAPWSKAPLLLRNGSWADDGTVSLSRDGSRLSWASARDDVVLIWDTTDGRLLARFAGTRSHVVAAALSDDGESLLWASAGDDDVRLLHVETGEVRAVLSGHDGPVTAVAFGEGSGRILTADRAGHLLIWESELGRARQLWSGLAGRHQPQPVRTSLHR